MIGFQELQIREEGAKIGPLGFVKLTFLNFRSAYF